MAREIPGEADRLALEVIAEGEVAEHLKERQVPGGHADVLDVRCTEDGLTGGEACVRRHLVAGEVRLEWMHARDREQRRRVERGWNQWE